MTVDFIIGDDNFQDHIDHVIDGEVQGRGLVPRNYESHPAGCYASAPAFDMPLIPRDQWADRIREMEANKSRLSDIRRSAGPGGGRIPSLDQDGSNYCWAHSTTMAIILSRAVMGEPYVRLSAYMPACLIKSYRNEGGWGALSLDFVSANGVPSVALWPEKSSSRGNDTPAMRENAKLHRAVESWADLNAAAYDRNVTEDQAMTILLSRVPLVGDFNWWSHSVCLLDPTLNVKPTAAALTTDFGSLNLNDPKDAAVMGDVFGKRGINSWTDNYGDLGEFVLTGSKAHLDGGVAPRLSTPSVV